VLAQEQTGQFGILDKKLIEATILPSLLLGHYQPLPNNFGELPPISSIKDAIVVAVSLRSAALRRLFYTV